MPFLHRLFPFFRWRLRPLAESVTREPADPVLEAHLSRSRFSIRLLRYWWAAQAIREAARKSGRPLVIADYGSGRGWLKRFVGGDIDARWIALDWQPATEWLESAGYDEIRECHFDRSLPLGDGEVDVVVALHVFEHLPRVGYSVSEIGRILAPGGTLLAGTPTMPGLFARWRQQQFRRRLAAGRLARGGHINSFSPGRIRGLVEDSGLTVEFATGSHLLRHTGSPLENLHGWVRLNQIWGALFPSLGSEVCVLARKPAVADPDTAAWSPQPLRRGAGRPRLVLSGAAAAGLALLAWGAWSWSQWPEQVIAQVIARQTFLDADRFMVVSHPSLPDFEQDRRVTVVCRAQDVEDHLPTLAAGTHVVVHEDHLSTLAEGSNEFVVDSRIDAGFHDFYLLRHRGEGTTLEHFLSQAEREG